MFRASGEREGIRGMGDLCSPQNCRKWTTSVEGKKTDEDKKKKNKVKMYQFNKNVYSFANNVFLCLHSAVL